MLDTLQQLITLLKNYIDNEINGFPFQLEAFSIEPLCSESLSDVCICVQNCDSCLHIISLIMLVFMFLSFYSFSINSNLKFFYIDV